jgi:ABC-2 type transport system ATP-binding protein
MASSGVTIFVTTHYMDDADNCDRISLIYNGDIIAMGSPDELKRKMAKGENSEISLEDVFVSLIENHNMKDGIHEAAKS